MWDNNDPSPNEPLTESMVAEAEREFGVRFPDAYLNALCAKNGGSTVGTHIRLPEQDIPEHLSAFVDHGFVSVGGIFGIGASNESVFAHPGLVEEWQLPAGLVLLDGRWAHVDRVRLSQDKEGSPLSCFLDADSGDTLLVANSFQEFFASLCRTDEIFDRDGNFISGTPDGAR